MMRSKLYKRLAHALSAFVLIFGQVFLPINPLLAQNAGAAANDKLVWCKLTGNGWQAQLSANADGKDGPLTTPLPGFEMIDGQVVAPDRSSETLKKLDAACMGQYTLTAPASTAICGSNNDTITAGAYMTISTQTAWLNNTKSVTFTATAPYVFLVNGNYVSTATFTYYDIAEPCTATTPTVEQTVVCGPNNDTYTTSTGNYTVSESAWIDGVKTFTFTANADYVFADGSTVYSIRITDANTPCEAATPTVTPAPVCKANNDGYTVSSHESYTLTSEGAWANNSRTFTFTANAGFVFAGGSTTYTVTITDDNTPCVIDNPVVQQAEICDINNDTYTVSTGNFTLTSDSDWVNGSRTLVFTANLGHIFADGPTYTVTLTDKGAPCIVPVPAKPSVNDPCGLNNASWNVPANTNTINWYYDASGNLHAKTIGNNTFPDGTTDYSYGKAIDSSVLCLASTPMVLIDEVCGLDNNDKVTVAGGSHYTYDVTRTGNTITVTITADPDYAFSDGKTSYTVEFTDKVTPCDATLPPAPTHTDPCDDLGKVNPPTWTSRPANTAAYTWNLNSDGSYTVTATPGNILKLQDGTYALAYTYYLPINDGKVCYETVEVAKPVPAYECGLTSTAQWTVPTSDEQVSWDIKANGELWAYAGKNIALSYNGELRSEINFGLAADNVIYKPCLLATPKAQVNEVCDINNDIVTAKDGDNYTATVSDEWVDGMKTITYTAKPGYVFEINGLSTFSEKVTDSGAPCEIDAPEEPTVTDICGPNNATWNVPTDSETVKWYLDENGNLIAETIGNKVFPGGHKTYSYGQPTDSNVPCATAPVFDDMTCEFNDVFGYTIPASEHYYYTVQVGDGPELEVDAGEYHNLKRTNQTITVRAYDAETDELAGGWAHSYKIPVCQVGMGGEKPVTPAVAVQELPKTGADDNSYMTLLGLAASVATYGAVLLLQRRNA